MAKETTIFYKTKEVSPMALLGNGYALQIALRKPAERDSMGRMVIPMLIYPSRALNEIYELSKNKKLNRLDGEAMWVKFPKKMVLDLNTSDLRAIQTLIFCGFEEERTELTNYYEGLLEWDQTRDKTEDTLRAAVVELQEEKMSLLKADATWEKLIAEKRKAMGLERRDDEDEEDRKGKETNK